MGVGYGGLLEGSRVGYITAMKKNLSTLAKEKTLEDIKKIIDDESIEYNKFEQEKKELQNEYAVIFSKIEKVHRGRFVGVTKKEEERMRKIYFLLSVIEDKKKKIQITAYQEIKARWNREIWEKKV